MRFKNNYVDNQVKLFFYVANSFSDGFDIVNVKNGNPGKGGTEYISLVIALLLSKKYCVTVFTKGNLLCSDHSVNIAHIENIEECFSYLDSCSYFIVSPVQIDYYKMYNAKFNRFIIWTHTEFCNNKKLINFAETNNVSKCIMLTPHSYAKYPHSVRKKSYIIHNPSVYIDNHYQRNLCLNNNIVFLGSMVPERGLDKLIDVLPKLLKKHKDIKVYVCGSSCLYNNKISNYEKEIKEAVYRNGLNDNVFFLGNIAISDNIALFKDAKIGITNLRFKGLETFCLSAVEMGSFEIPVIAGNIDGIKNTLPRKCGYRIKNKRALIRKINILLSNNKKNYIYGNNYQRFVMNHYSKERALELWDSAINNKKIVDDYKIPLYIFIETLVKLNNLIIKSIIRFLKIIKLID